MLYSVRSREDNVVAQKLLTPQEAAEYLNIPTSTVRIKARQGLIPATKVGRRWRFDPDLLKKWVQEKSLQPKFPHMA